MSLRLSLEKPDGTVVEADYVCKECGAQDFVIRWHLEQPVTRCARIRKNRQDIVDQGYGDIYIKDEDSKLEQVQIMNTDADLSDSYRLTCDGQVICSNCGHAMWGGLVQERLIVLPRVGSRGWSEGRQG